MAMQFNDDLVTDVSAGRVGQITEIEEDNDVSCVIVHFDYNGVCEENADSLYFTRSDLYKMLAVLEAEDE